MTCSVAFGPSSPLSTHALTKPDPFIRFPIAFWKPIDKERPPSYTTSFFWYSGISHFSSTSLQYKTWSTIRTVCCCPSAADMCTLHAPFNYLTTLLRVSNSCAWNVKNWKVSDCCYILFILRQRLIDSVHPLLITALSGCNMLRACPPEDQAEVIHAISPISVKLGQTEGHTQ